MVTLLIALVVAALGATAVPAQGQTFTRAFTDDVWFNAPGQRWIPRTVSTGAKLALLEIDWRGVEPSPPPAGADPTNPADPNFNFHYVDVVVKEFAGTGIAPAFLVTDAPRWAETPGGPSDLEDRGAWRPNATAFGQVARALARRYSGSYPDPDRPGHTLPRVRYFQAWAEANFSIHLAPQWVFSGGRLLPASPGIYRDMLNSFYAGIKGVHSDNVVITEGSGPYGDSPGPCTNSESGPGCRMPPAMFVREMMCLHGYGLQPESCPNPAHFDALAMDPYEVSSPTTHAFNRDDVSAPDLGKLTRVVNKAVSDGRALPQARKQLWVTEFSYDSNPPNPYAVSLAEQARWLEQSLYLFWKQGVSTAVWYLLRDQSGTDWLNSYFSGVYFNNGERKPSFEAYRFPLVVMPSGRAATVWGISPRTGRVSIQHQSGRRWRTIFRLRVRRGAVLTRTVSRRMRGNFRAAMGGETSLVWKR